MYNCICILPFLGFKDTPFANFASTSHIFDNVKMLPSKITHPTCSFNALRILHIKILHLQSPKIHYRKYLSHNILCVLITSQLEPIHYLQKIDIRNSSEYEMGAGDTQSVNFCVNGFERTCLKLRSSKFEFKFICFKQKFTLLCVTRSWNLSKNSYINFL